MKRSLKFWASAIFVLVIATIAFWSRLPPLKIVQDEPADVQDEKWADEPIRPIPQNNNLDHRKVALGEKLFNEPLLSKNDQIACANCHKFNMGGTDQLAHSVGIEGQIGTVNSLTVFNATFNFKQFWDGRAETLEAQIDGPTHAANEMGSNWQEITSKLRQVPEYRAAFAASYPEGIQADTIKDAIATFERSLITPNARFDQYLRGNQQAITKEESEGYQLFKSHGCISCHQGINIGGNMFQKFGVMGDYFQDRGQITKADYGRFNITKAEVDKFVFKVPSLRNVELTAPYFHDGSAKRLEDAVEVMGKYQLGRNLTPHEVELIVKFLKTLTGNYQKYNL